MTRITLVVIYLACMGVAVVSLDASVEDTSPLVTVWVVASMLLGWGTGRPSFALLTLLALPFSLPFGYPDQSFYEPLPLWFSAGFYALISAGLIVLTALMRRGVEICRRRRAPS
ncbi:MAG TPA: hypothetical protein VF093_04820 [Solirubrobacterales bacterium]